jgi:hypothetical protein
MSRKSSLTLGRAGTFERITAGVAWFFILVPAALSYLYVHAFGVNVVFADAWDMVLVFRKWSSGRLAFADLYAQHNEHRMFFPKGAELFLGILTRYNNVAEMYLIVSCFLVTAAILLLAFFREMLYSSGRSNFKVYAFVAALGSATVASFSTAQGLLVWPAGLLGLLLGPAATSRKKVFVGIWGIVGVAEWVAYFVDYKTPQGHPPLLSVLSDIGTATEYFLTLLGSALFWQPDHALTGGLLISCLALGSFLAMYRSGVLREHSFWISLFFYSLLILATITLGRAGMFGVWQAAISRYTTFSILAVASVYAVLAKMLFARRSSIGLTVLLITLVGAILLSSGISYRNGIEVGRVQEASRERAAYILKTYDSEPDVRLAAALYPRPETVRRRAPLLERLGYNVFSEP